MGIPDLFVDADSCPVQQEIVEIAASFSVEAIFIASYNHVKRDNGHAVWKYVDAGKEAVDLYIMNHVKKGDIAVTQDIGLASTLLGMGVYVLSPRGTLFEEKDIDTALDLRYLSAKARRRGVYGKGPKPYTDEDRSRFVHQLTNILSKFAGIR
ncbi:DUF188 domain-containing protein [Bacillus canaveralius]|uniref:UPF0178 protein CU635_02425 n=1 Tax=Bacillus canaveralius TaxID=1403243 RepID=A0A2N5GR61_9BACI|nr:MULTISPECIES: DUF188 domain-containing protein [Bacillus]PLR85914.1 DUF188 domain-containing protein [Bacillus canaveralius]PLR87624.1 DUF188 domain-containing protein [Bacillus sp. V33-4]PLS00033.1 DUF188 domain-containing protein [Bacillus canaveralius]RSK56230.1 DUF188 domain-containing protein [Bacillus canaveralius]